MRAHGILVGVLTAGLFVSAASAQLIINPIGKPVGDRIEVGLSAAYSSIDYAIDRDEGHGIDRMVIGVSLSKAIDETTDICGSAAWLAKSNPEDDGVDSIGGYLLSLGARKHVFERGLGKVTLYGLGHYMAEKYDWNVHGSYKMYLFEATGGAIVSYDFNPGLTGYAGAELIAYSDGELQGNGRPDFDRDGRITIRGGTTFNMTKYWIRTELALGSEKALTVGAGIPF
jgi:hypothetical protein